MTASLLLRRQRTGSIIRRYVSLVKGDRGIFTAADLAQVLRPLQS